VGRFVVIRDVDGRRHAISAGSVAAICKTDDGVLILLLCGRTVQLAQSMPVMPEWMDGRG
jgi:hypothetical protein